jgi:hypothetical protein
MPWDFKVIPYRPKLHLSADRLMELNAMIVRAEASFWWGPICNQCPLLWDLFPDDFVSIDLLLNPCSLLGECMINLPAPLVEIVTSFVREPCQFSEIIDPPSCSGFVTTIHCNDRQDLPRWPSLNFQEQEMCLLRIMPSHLVDYAQVNEKDAKMDLIEYYPTFQREFPSPQELFKLWKQINKDGKYEDKEFPELDYYLQRLLFCYQCGVLGEHGFSVVCDH